MIPKENINELEQELNHDVQNLYIEIFKGNEKTNFDINKDGVPEHYYKLFENVWIDKLSELSQDIKANKVKPERDTISKWYLNTSKIVSAKNLKELSGILPSPELLAKYPQYAKEFGDSQ